MNAILFDDPRMPAFTDMRPVREALGERWREFDWVVTDVEAWADHWYSSEDLVATGPELDGLLDARDIQWIWAVFSGVPRDAPLRVPEPVPTANGRRELWLPGSRAQHPDAVVEIVCWDSSETLLISQDEDLVARFRRYFAGTMDLDDYIEQSRDKPWNWTRNE